MLDKKNRMKRLLNVFKSLNRGTFYTHTHTQVISEKKDMAESGRSMVETLGTLAIMGVLSVVGITIFRNAMNSYKANSIVRAVNRRATVLSADKNFGTGFTPDSTFENDTNYPIVCNSLNDNFFACTVADVPQAVCQKVLNLDWKMPASITPTTCTATNEMAFTFSKDLDGAMTQCADDTECTTPQATCVNGFCVEPEAKTCDTEHPENPCGDACMICNNATQKCENACTRKAYLQSDGGQYIDSGILLNQDSSVELTFQLTEEQFNKAVFGALDTTSNRYELYIRSITQSYPGMYEMGYYKNIKRDTASQDLAQHTVYQNKNKIFYDGDLKNTWTKGNFSTIRPCYFFTFSTSQSYSGMIGKIFSAKIWQNDILTLNLIPVRYNPTNEACMYDKVSKELFCNQGSGSFTTD